MEPDPLDRAALEALQATTDREFVGELIQAYLDDSPGLFAAMRQAVASASATDFTRAAHSLKSSSASLGAAGLAAAARELETLGKQSQLEAAAAKLDEVLALFEMVRIALETYRRGS
jgi:HPt (histidine-containing phosphotransfer) domain-containing protein